MTDIKTEALDAEIDLYGDTGDTALDEQMNENEVLGTAEPEEPAVVTGNGANNEDDSAVLDDGEGDDLFDAVLTTESTGGGNQSITSDRSVSTPPTGVVSNQFVRRHSCYIGNMTWWTTDQDLADVLANVGLSDVVDIKFYENRTNGQSKGFATVSFASDSSLRQAMDKMGSKQLHGQQLIVMPYNKTSLGQFEAATRRPNEGRTGEKQRDPKHENKQQQQQQDHGHHQNGKGPQYIGTFRLGPGGPPPGPPGVAPPMRGPPPPVHPPPVMGQPIVLPPGSMGPRMLPMRHHGPPFGAPPVPPPATNRPPPGFPPHAMPPRHGIVPPPISGPPPGFPVGAHVNPNVYPGVATNVAAMSQPPPQENTLSESEFEEIMNRNRTVSSSAISRAVSDAAAGDYASAIETLVTAISLIRQSRVAHDDRCKVLITSLQDTLHGIEAKSYARRSKDRSRDHSRSPDRGRKRHRRSRSRSRSRERYEYSPRHSTSRRY